MHLYASYAYVFHSWSFWSFIILIFGGDFIQDIILKYIKIFASAFLGVLLPELCLIFQSGFPVDLNAFIVVLIPAVCAAVSAGFAALGNYVKSLFKNN